MEYKVYEFPTKRDGLHAVEEKLCELLTQYREDPKALDPAEVDFIDWANNVLSTSK